MSVIAVVGSQWGDEGKGRVVDYLATDADLVIRYGGGNNAGHTVINRHGHFKLHLIPSGIFYPATRNLLGNGVVINPPALVAELDDLATEGFPCDNLFISDRAHLVMPYHVVLDQLDERERGAARIGTTSRGIGPAYVDKVARRGFRMTDLLEPATFHARLEAALPRIRRLMAGYADDEMADAIGRVDGRGADRRVLPRRGRAVGAPCRRRCRPRRPRPRRRRADPAGGAARHDAGHRLGRLPVRHELLADPGGASLGAGLPAVRIDRVVGVAKAYTTAVGAGPVPTELEDEDGERLRERGAEYGTSTGRPRRCGWYDAVAVRFSVRLAGYSSIVLTKLDVLDEFERMRVAHAYRDPVDGRVWETVPASTSVYERLEPVYEELAGWGADTTACRSWDALPSAARVYVERLEELAGVPISHVSVGPERDQMIVR